MQLFKFIILSFIFSIQMTFSAPVAKVNGAEITAEDLSASLSQLSEFQKRDLLSNEGSKERLILEIVDQEVLAQEAKKMKLNSSSDFQAAVKLFERQYLANKVSEEHMKGKITEDAQMAYYEKNKNRFSTSQVRAQHVLLKTEKQAREVLIEAQKKGANFGIIAEKYSEDPTVKINRGDLGYFTRDKMMPEFSDAVFSSKKGSIIGPIQTSLGFHVIKVLDRKAGSQLPYGDVKLTVKNMLERDLRTQWLNELKSKSKIEVKL